MESIKGPKLAQVRERPATLFTAFLATLGFSASVVFAQGNLGETAPKLGFKSVLGQYQSFGDQSLRPWQESNAVVEKIGGWRVYAKEANQKEISIEAVQSPAIKTADPANGKTESHGHHGRRP